MRPVDATLSWSRVAGPARRLLLPLGGDCEVYEMQSSRTDALTRCLVFNRQGLVRRPMRYPSDWRSMREEELRAFSGDDSPRDQAGSGFLMDRGMTAADIARDAGKKDVLALLS